MAKLTVLGSSNAIASLGQDTTHLAVSSGGRLVLIDCGMSPVVRLAEAGLDLTHITDLVLTHFHPDHVGSLPALLMDMWLLGRREHLSIYGYGHTLTRVKAMMDLYDWAEWRNFYPVTFIEIPESELAPVIVSPELEIYSSPVRHFIPTMGLRIHFPLQQKTLAYSCDTEPCPQLLPLAQGADVLFHEASGPYRVHSSAAQAGELAARAGVGQLYLIHYPGKASPDELVAEAKIKFPGSVMLARDLISIDF